MVQPLWRTIWRFLRKLNIELPYETATPLLGIYPDKTFLENDTCTLMFIAALVTRAKTGEQPKCPSTDEWIKKMWYIYTVAQPFAATWMELETLTRSEVSQKEKDKDHMISLKCGV